MRNALALLVLVSLATPASASERERPEPRPCKCAKRPPPVTFELLDKRRDTFQMSVLVEVRRYRSAVSACIKGSDSDAVLKLAFARNAKKPRVSAIGSKRAVSCLERITWDGFSAAPDRTVIRVRASAFDRG